MDLYAGKCSRCKINTTLAQNHNVPCENTYMWLCYDCIKICDDCQGKKKQCIITRR